jgi:hypothetical protein
MIPARSSPIRACPQGCGPAHEKHPVSAAATGLLVRRLEIEVVTGGSFAELLLGDAEAAEIERERAR